jgi:hypothetical protein
MPMGAANLHALISTRIGDEFLRDSAGGSSASELRGLPIIRVFMASADVVLVFEGAATMSLFRAFLSFLSTLQPLIQFLIFVRV